MAQFPSNLEAALELFGPVTTPLLPIGICAIKRCHRISHSSVKKSFHDVGFLRQSFYHKITSVSVCLSIDRYSTCAAISSPLDR